jgi:hypothetical protein
MSLTNWRWRYLSQVTIALGLGLIPTVSVAAQATAAETCTISADPSRRLELPDGRIVSVDAKSVAASGGSIMALGPYVYTFPAGAMPSTSPLPADPLVGVLIDASGVVRLVPSPLRDRAVVFARAAAGPMGSFHVLFVTGIDSVDGGPAPDDSATIWYAPFAHGSWGTPQRITETRGAALNPEFTSDLLARDGSLAFVFPFVDNRSAGSSGGLVALRRRNGRWWSDTLRTYLKPPAARATYATNDTLVVLFSQNVRGAKAEDVYLSRAGREWSAPQRIGGNGARPVSDLSLVTGPEGIVASWSTWIWLDAASNVIEWSRIATTGARSPVAVVDSGGVTYPFELVIIAERHPLWLHQGEPYGSTVTWAMAAGGDHLLRGSLTIPFHNSRPKAVTLSPDRTLVLTMKRGGPGAEPMIASWMTDLRIRCPRAERR